MATTEVAGVVPLTARQAPAWVDGIAAAVAAVLTVVVLLTADLTAIDPGLREAPPWVIAVAALGASGVGLRRWAPLAGLVLTGAAATVVSLGSHYTSLLPYLTLFCLYAVAAHGTRRQAVAGIGLLAVSFTGLVAFDVPDLTIGDVATTGALGVAAVALGDAMRLRRAHQLTQLSTARAEAAQALAESQQALAESQRAVAESQRAVADERLRIARELHDVVAHSMSLIAVQAGVGAHLIHQDVKAAERALDVIADTSRDALAQARSVIGLLRSGDDAQPSLAGLVALEPLVQGVRDAGLPVDLAVSGTVRDVPAAVDLAAYRIVQEGLTNAVRHAPGRPVSVRLERTASELLIDIQDRAATGPIPMPARRPAHGTHPSPTGGYGLAGLRERAAAVGGELTAQPTADGGFRVSARLPVLGAA